MITIIDKLYQPETYGIVEIASEVQLLIDRKDYLEQQLENCQRIIKEQGNITPQEIQALREERDKYKAQVEEYKTSPAIYMENDGTTFKRCLNDRDIWKKACELSCYDTIYSEDHREDKQAAEKAIQEYYEQAKQELEKEIENNK